MTTQRLIRPLKVGESFFTKRIAVGETPDTTERMEHYSNEKMTVERTITGIRIEYAADGRYYAVNENSFNWGVNHMDIPRTNRLLMPDDVPTLVKPSMPNI